MIVLPAPARHRQPQGDKRVIALLQQMHNREISCRDLRRAIGTRRRRIAGWAQGHLLPDLPG